MKLTKAETFIRERIAYHTNNKMFLTVKPTDCDDDLGPNLILTAYNEYRKSDKEIPFAQWFDAAVYKNPGMVDEIEYLEKCLVEDIDMDVFEKKGEHLSAQFEAMVSDSPTDMLNRCGYEGTRVDTHAFLDDYYKINILFATEAEKSLNMSSIMDMYWGDYSFLHDADKFREVADNALTYLIYQQGYTLETALRAYYGKKSDSKFLASVAAEVHNHPTETGELTALVAARGDELINLLQGIAKGIASRTGYIKMPESTMIGIIRAWHGTGSDLGIKLEKPFVVPCNMVRNLQIEGAGLENHGSTVNEIYGFVPCWYDKSSCWDAEASVTTERLTPRNLELETKDLEAARELSLYGYYLEE